MTLFHKTICGVFLLLSLLSSASAAVVEVATLLATIGIAVTDPGCGISAEGCGCRQSYIIVEAMSPDERWRGPRMFYDKTLFAQGNTNPLASGTDFGQVCQIGKSRVVQPMGAGGIEVGNAFGDSTEGLIAYAYWLLQRDNGDTYTGCSLQVYVKNQLFYGQELTGKLFGNCGQYSSEMPNLKVARSEEVKKAEGHSAVFYVYMEGTPAIQKPSAADESAFENLEPSEDTGAEGFVAPEAIAAGPGAAPESAPVSSPSPKPASSPAPASAGVTIRGAFAALSSVVATALFMAA